MSILSPAPAQPGPYASKFPLPKTDAPIKMFVTREMAGDWLDNRNRPGTEHQRKPSRSKVALYSTEINAGRWRLTHQGLAFDVNGWMTDGQHRLQSLRNADPAALRKYYDQPKGATDNQLGLTFWVFAEQDTDLFARIDTGNPRQARQLYLGANGGIITASVRYLFPGQIGVYQRTLSPAAVLAEAAKWPELATYAANVNAANRKGRVPSAPHLAVLAQASRSEFADRISTWLEGVSDGYNLARGDMRGHLRERFHGTRVPSSDAYPLIVKAWNNYAVGKTGQVLKVNYNEAAQLVVGLPEFGEPK